MESFREVNERRRVTQKWRMETGKGSGDDVNNNLQSVAGDRTGDMCRGNLHWESSE